MAHMSRRSFIAFSGALAASLGLPRSMVGSALAAPLAPADVPTTLRETIRQSTTGNRAYRTLLTAPGESFIVREDLVVNRPSPGRVARRRSLAYLGHTSDIHIQDTQSPSRLEPVMAFSPTLMPGICRPQESMSLFVQAQMVQAFSDAANSPVTGAPMAAVLNTGDSADQISNLETRWYIKVMDGVPVMANSGAEGVYEGVEVWPEATYAYHPDDPSGDMWGEYGFPQIPGLMEAIVTTEVTSPGMPAPGTRCSATMTCCSMVSSARTTLRSLATGHTKYWSFPSWVTDQFTGMATDPSPQARAGLRAPAVRPWWVASNA